MSPSSTSVSGPAEPEQASAGKAKSESEQCRPSSEDDKGKHESWVKIQSTEDYNEVFHPENSIGWTPPRRSKPFPATTAKEVSKSSPAMDVQLPGAKSQGPSLISCHDFCFCTQGWQLPSSLTHGMSLKTSDFLPTMKTLQQAELVDEDAMSQIQNFPVKLELCTTTRLPQIQKLLQSKYESYIQTRYPSQQRFCGSSLTFW
ncbi:katanin p80 WD40 repeat-containing subunit B1 [Sigmodon hispidus]